MSQPEFEPGRTVDLTGLAGLVAPLVAEQLRPAVVEAIISAILPRLDELSTLLDKLPAAAARQQTAHGWPVWPPSPN